MAKVKIDLNQIQKEVLEYINTHVFEKVNKTLVNDIAEIFHPVVPGVDLIITNDIIQIRAAKYHNHVTNRFLVFSWS